MLIRFLIFPLLALSLFATGVLPPLVKDGEFVKRFENYTVLENSNITSVAVSFDSKYIVSGSKDGYIRLWDIKTKKLLYLFKGHLKAVTSVAISYDSKYIVSGSRDKTVKLWDIQTRKLLYTFKGHSNDITSVAVSRDLRYIVSGSRDSSVRLWDIKSGKVLYIFKGHKDIVSSVAVSFDSKYIVSGSWDKTVKVWELKTKKLLYTFKGHKDIVSSVALSCDSKYIISGSWDKTVKVWERESKKLLNTFYDHDDIVTSVAVSLDDRYIISGSKNGAVKLWDLKRKKLISLFRGHTNTVTSVAVSSDLKYIVSGSRDKSVRLWDMKAAKQIFIFKGDTDNISSVSISFDSKYIVSGSWDGTVKLWDLKTKKLIYTFKGHTDIVSSVVISPDSRYIISASWDGSVKLWDLKSKELIYTFKGHTLTLSSIKVSFDSKYIISGSWDGTVRLWDIKNKKLLYTFKNHKDIITSVALNYNSRYMVCGVGDDIRLWDMKRKRLLHTFKGHTNTVTSVVISGRYIISGSKGGSVKLWDMRKQRLLYTLGEFQSPVTSIDASFDAKYIACAFEDGSIRLWSMKTKKLLYAFKAHKDIVSSVAISSDSKYIISGSWDGTVKVWDIKAKREILSFLGGERGNWSSFDKRESSILRGDDGSFYHHKKNFTPLAPPDMASKDNLKISYRQNSITIEQGKTANIDITITNEGDKEAFWIKPVMDDNKRLILYPSFVYKLNPSQSQNITLSLTSNADMVNPRPIDTNLSLRWITANKSEYKKTFPVRIKTPLLKLKRAELQRDKKSIKIVLQNRSDQTIKKLKLYLLKPQKSSEFEPFDIKPNETVEKTFSLSKKTDANKISFEAYETQLPNFEWIFKDQKLVYEKLPLFLYIVLMILFIATAVALFYYKRYKDPLVIKLSQNPEKLCELFIEELKIVKTKLSKTGRLKSVLLHNGVGSERFNSAIEFEKADFNQKAALFAKRMDARFVPLQDNAFMIKMSEFFSLNVKNFVLFMSEKEDFADMLNDIKNIPQYKNSIIFIMAKDSILQKSIYKKNLTDYEKFVVPKPQEITKILLCEDGKEQLAKVFAEQLTLTQISPYQLGGGVNRPSMFFGREKIISYIVGRESSNYMFIGSRQIGKSSLLKALHREYQKRGDLSYYISLNEGDLLKGVKSALKLKNADMDEIISFISKSEKSYILLIDEADKFIVNEKKNSYKILNVFRKLSEEGRCSFVLAGFWELYKYAVLDYQSPLKNFGEIIEIGALEYEACQKMIKEPMKQLGFEFENEDVIEKIIEKTGQRANLIALVCHNIIENLGKEKRVIDKTASEKAMKQKNVTELFNSWRELDSSKRANRLDRIIVYATVKRDFFTLNDLLEKLKNEGLSIDIADLEKSIERLIVSYTIQKTKNRKYSYKVPLFREYILKSEFELKLKEEIAEYRKSI